MARKFSDLVAASMSPESQARAEVRTNAMLADLRLAELRRAQDLSQLELSAILGVTQSEVSKMERRADVYVSTLRKYVEATGGTLEILAHFASGTVRIDQFCGAPLPDRGVDMGTGVGVGMGVARTLAPTAAHSGMAFDVSRAAMRLRLALSDRIEGKADGVIPINPWLASKRRGSTERVQQSDLTVSIEPEKIACGS